MLEKCPVCKCNLKTNDIICKRCNTNLNIFFELEKKSDEYFKLSQLYFTKNQTFEALRYILLSIHFKKDHKNISFLKNNFELKSNESKARE